jgi:hypothetical protein
VHPEKKTIESEAAGPGRPAGTAFEKVDCPARDRYERLRAYVLLDPAERPRTSAAQFDLRRFNRFGVLGLGDGVGVRCDSTDLEIRLLAIGAEDAEDRRTRLCELLAGMLIRPEQGGGDATGCAVRSGFHRASGA